MPEGRVIHLDHGERHVLRYLGRVDYTLAPAIERFAEELLAGIQPGGLVFDLRACAMLDSTNLGLMARLATRAEDHGGRRCTIVSTNDDITDVLRSMGFPSMFEIASDHPDLHQPGPEEEIALVPSSQQDLVRTMLEAHRLLANASVDEKDAATFRTVVQYLEAEMNMLS
jgi:anti-anti-sigma factor